MTKQTLQIMVAILRQVDALSAEQAELAREMVLSLDDRMELGTAVKVVESVDQMSAAVRLARVKDARRRFIKGELEVGDFEAVLDTEVGPLADDLKLLEGGDRPTATP